MNELYIQTKQNGELFFHKNYCLFNNRTAIAFDAGAIQLISIEMASALDNATVTVSYRDRSCSQWSTKWISSYIFQFGVAVSSDGKYIFAQTWENGLVCLDSHSGEQVWKSKSKRGITNLFVNDNTILCHQRERALQLIDIHTDKVLKEKRPATAWGFTAISHKYILCQVTMRRWEVIDTETLETTAVFSHRDFTDAHEDYCINFIQLEGNILTVRGFKNVWDNSVVPAKMLPNLEFEHHLVLSLAHE